MHIKLLLWSWIKGLKTFIEVDIVHKTSTDCDLSIFHLIVIGIALDGLYKAGSYLSFT